MITRLSVYDFDGTLMDTPMPDVGREVWKQKTGEKYPHVGWWGRKESLDMDVFEINPFPSVLNNLNDDMTRSDTYTVILTSRLEKLRPQIEGILQHHNISADQILLKTGGKEKDERIQELISQLPDTIKEVNLYDDREKEFNAFRNFREMNPNLQVNIYKADEGKISLIETHLNADGQIIDLINSEIQKIRKS